MPRPDHVLVLRAPTLVLNPAFDPAVIAVEEQTDPDNAAAEYAAQWRRSGAGLVWASVLDAAIDGGVVERPPEPPVGDDYYCATVDLASGLGTGKDWAALSIQHEEQGHEKDPSCCVQDLLRGWEPPFDAPGVVVEIAGECARYGITQVIGDGFAKGFVTPEFERHGLHYLDAPTNASEAYVLALAALNGKRARLLDHSVARRQWLALQRSYRSGGRIHVDHRAGAHDDLANVTALGIVVALELADVKKPLRVWCR